MDVAESYDGREPVLGFTGSQLGINDYQKDRLRLHLGEGWDAIHHGGCIGADYEAHMMALECGIPVILHPCNIEKKRAYCPGIQRAMPITPPLDRNKNIVEMSDFIIACPKEVDEVVRSGTWMTIRWARRQYKDGLIIYPDREEKL